LERVGGANEAGHLEFADPPGTAENAPDMGDRINHRHQ
jgi:hypothetical protein